MDIEAYISRRDLEALIATARREDLGPDGLDITTQLMGVEDRAGQAELRARRVGVFCGGGLLRAIADAYDRSLDVDMLTRDGHALAPGQSAARFTGSLHSILTMERVALNFVTHLSGIATLTARYVAAVQGTRTKITDTRKTLPGLRGLQKYAVACGGGVNHRDGLYDAVLVKDNHLAHVPVSQWTATLTSLVRQARAAESKLKFVEVEVDNLDQLRVALPAKPDIILLDNMPPEVMREAVGIRDRMRPRVLLEASGGVTLENVADIARTGVDRIAIGALTHSAPALDLGLDIL